MNRTETECGLSMRELMDARATIPASSGSDIAGAASEAIYRVLGSVHQAWVAYERYRCTRETVSALRSLDNATLRDIGIERGHIDFVARRMCQVNGEDA